MVVMADMVVIRPITAVDMVEVMPTTNKRSQREGKFMSKLRVPWRPMNFRVGVARDGITAI